MRTIFNSRSSSLGAAILLTAAVYAAPAAAWAKDHSGTDSAVGVVSSTSFDGQAASDMKLEEKNGKSYLRIVFAAGQETQLVDITRPEKARVASNAGEERTQLGQNLVMVRMATASPDRTSSQEFTLWDISRSGHPRLVQKFSDVQRVIEDGRGYVYVLHHGGLSVIRSKDNNNSTWPDMGIYG